jgi:serine/threonine-protein kinase
MSGAAWDAMAGGVLDGLFGEPADLSAGPDFGERYRVEKVLGQGGQGKVFLAVDTVLGREVAIKVALDARFGRTLRAEADLLGRLAHPAIPALYDRGLSPDGSVFVVMQFVAGQTLRQSLRSIESLSTEQRLRWFRSVAAAVGHAHGQKVLHRDLKPSNVIISTTGDAYLVDWGLAATGDPRAVCGTPGYAAPEQLEGQVADRRSDIYALGVLLYEMLTGELPYARRVTDFEEFRRLRAGLGTVPLRKRRPDLPPSLGRIVTRAMAAQSAGRYDSCAALLADLDAAMAGRPLATDPPQLPWGIMASVAASLVALLLGTALGFGLGTGEAPRPQAPTVSLLGPVSTAPASEPTVPDAVPRPAWPSAPAPVIDPAQQVLPEATIATETPAPEESEATAEEGGPDSEEQASQLGEASPVFRSEQPPAALPPMVVPEPPVLLPQLPERVESPVALQPEVPVLPSLDEVMADSLDTAGNGGPPAPLP